MRDDLARGPEARSRRALQTVVRASDFIPEMRAGFLWRALTLEGHPRTMFRWAVGEAERSVNSPARDLCQQITYNIYR